LEPLKKAKNANTKILALVNVLGSSLYRMAEERILLGAGPEKAVASTKAVTAKMAHLLLLAYSMTNKEAEGKTLLNQASKAMKAILEPSSDVFIKSVAEKVKDQQHVYVIGRGLSYAVALETAIKIKEISYIHAEGLAGGELKHGPLALIEQGTPCIVLAPNDETHSANLSSAMEVKARGGYIIGISPIPHDAFDVHIAFDDVGVASMLPMTVIAQLFAYHLATLKQLDPDKPRNLAKSVTVK
jgi:glucosamine--fructose-6-phosphate aminotransferase (isomerizing)